MTTTRDHHIDEFCKIDAQIKLLEALKREHVAALLEYMPSQLTDDNKSLESAAGNKIRFWVKHDLVEDLVEPRVSKAMWNRITKRKLVKALWEAEIARGKLDRNLLDDCRKPSRPTVVRST